jgi:tetratricopeptide (TPR) repeat protein
MALDGRVRLVTQADGYLIDVDPESVDLHLFRLRQRQARAMASSGEVERAVALLREADAFWRGDTALASLPGEWIASVRHGLEEERRNAILERAELELGLGRHADLVPELHRLLGQYGLDEAFIGCYLKSLYLCGRYADSLDAYARARRRMVDELGSEPGPELSSLHQRILRRDPKLATASAAFPRDVPVPDTLPPAAVDFVGRADEIRVLTSAASHPAGRAVTAIEGLAGAGKTALAVHVARSCSGQYPDGQLYVAFRAHDPAQAPTALTDAVCSLLRMLGVPASRIPSAFPERAALWRAELARRCLIVVLDDVPAGEDIESLLVPAGRSHILITSRGHLHDVHGVRVLVLRPLTADDAAALFTRIVGPGKADDAMTAELVRLCGYLPLAIQLAARRLRQHPSLTAAELAAEIEDARHSPGQGTDGLDPQVARAFELSYVGLTPELQRTFRHLGMSPCSDITVHAAAALDGTDVAEAAENVNRLMAHHLLEAVAPGHYRFHDLLRSYAMSQSFHDPGPERRQVVSRLLDYYLDAADHADRMLFPHRRRLAALKPRVSPLAPAMASPDQARAWMEAEWHSIRQVAQHAREHEWIQEAVGLSHVLAGFLETSGYWDDALTLHELALQAARDLDDPGWIAQASLDLSRVSQNTGSYARAAERAETAAAICRSLGNRSGEAEALDRLGTVSYYSARFPESLAYYEEARAAYDDAGDKSGVADTLIHSAIASWSLGRPAEAVSQLSDALGMYRRVGDRRGEAKTLNNMGVIYRYHGFHRDAVRRYQESLAIFKEIGGRQNEALLHHNMGTMFHYKGNYEEALISCRRALLTYRATGDRRNHAGVLNDIGAAFQELQQYEEAEAHHEKALMIAEEIGERYEQLIALRGMADARRGSGNHADALDRYQKVLAIAREIGHPYQEARVLDGMGYALLQIRGREAARICWRQALDIFQRLGVPEAEAVRLRLQSFDAQAS